MGRKKPQGMERLTAALNELIDEEASRRADLLFRERVSSILEGKATNGKRKRRKTHKRTLVKMANMAIGDFLSRENLNRIGIRVLGQKNGEKILTELQKLPDTLRKQTVNELFEMSKHMLKNQFSPSALSIVERARKRVRGT